jgi:hypothetical protein
MLNKVDCRNGVPYYTTEGQFYFCGDTDSFLNSLKDEIRTLADAIQDDLNGHGETDRRYVIKRLRQLLKRMNE